MTILSMCCYSHVQLLMKQNLLYHQLTDMSDHWNRANFWSTHILKYITLHVAIKILELVYLCKALFRLVGMLYSNIIIKL